MHMYFMCEKRRGRIVPARLAMWVYWKGIFSAGAGVFACRTLRSYCQWRRTAERCESSHGKPGTEANKPFGGNTWRIIPVRKWLLNPIYKSFSPFGRGPTTPVSGLTITMVIYHLPVLWWSSKQWEMVSNAKVGCKPKGTRFTVGFPLPLHTAYIIWVFPKIVVPPNHPF